MTHELFALMRENPFGTFVIILCFLWACERAIVAFINRNKPECDCEKDCECDCDEEDEEEDVVVASGGQVDDDDNE